MGCVHPGDSRSSSPRGDGLSGNESAEGPNVFYVRNLDEACSAVSEGYLELGPQGVELRQTGKAALQWPHRCLRRYGFNGDLFSFESGRHCSTGPGIFAFRCVRAEALYNCLEESIRRLNSNGVGSSATQNGVAGRIPNQRPLAVFNSDRQTRGVGPRPENSFNGNGNGTGLSSISTAVQPMFNRYVSPGEPTDYLRPTSSTPAAAQPVTMQSNGVGSNGVNGPHLYYMNTNLPNVEEEGDHSYMNTRVLADGTVVSGDSKNGPAEPEDDDIPPPAPPRSAKGSTASDNNNALTPSSRGSADNQFQYPPSSAASRIRPGGVGQHLPPLLPPSMAQHQAMPSQKSILYAELDLSSSKGGSVSSPSTAPQSAVSAAGAREQGHYTDMGRSGSSSEDDLFQGQNGGTPGAAVNGFGNGGAPGHKYTNCSALPVSGGSGGSAAAVNGFAQRNIGGLVRINYKPDQQTLHVVPPTPKEDQYTEIDFPKTEALNKKTTDNHGGRMTRHDSAADDL